ncbi:GAF domain-containing protein [Actinoplanes friuliensis]|uniref:Putative Transcriptional activator of acetoin/glycerol metabolism n=1 Tax=Actinoplanes friuliensis DSM 7358 TaxID=1246995 RepID=U5W3H2_9ACTN|nr:GAF domain-containing protein [Actinoplanes friuliensis]AGZ43763.1 putative Transcriptional activator of acetoin/glycerol metabolism [Actinoplanes friuliensis DSM 7358]
MGELSAISPGTDLSQHARELTRVHDAVLGGRRAPGRPRAVVARSWSRVMRAGLDPDGANARDPFTRDEVERRRRESPLSLIVGELAQVIQNVALLVVTDADGVILWRVGGPSVLRRADTLGFGEGATWTESVVGTNAIGTALVEAAPVQLFSAEHFEQAQHAWYCSAHPIHDPRTGELLGIVDVSGPALTLHPAIEALVGTGVRLAESQLWRHHAARLERLRRSAEHIVGTAAGPLLIVDDHGWVAHNSGVAARDRIAAPRADTALAVPGLGLCLPERLAEGWIVRPAGAAHTIRARLDRTGSPLLSVTGAGSVWRAPLTRRHAEILTLLHHAGAEGLSAGRLSRALYGDDAHVVTVRAEISRLRRAIGALVVTNPYRLADGVDLQIVS